MVLFVVVGGGGGGGDGDGDGVTTSVIVTSFSFSYKLLNMAQVKMFPISILAERIRKNLRD